MKLGKIMVIGVLALSSGCDRNKDAELEKERARLAAEQSALAAEKEKFLAEKDLAERQAKADAALRKVEADRAALDAEKARLEEEKASIAANKAADEKTRAAALAAQAELARHIAGQQLELELAEVRAKEEKARLEAAQKRALAQKAELEKATAAAKAREDAARAAQAEAIRKTTAIFYDALAQYGSWVDTDRYGYVWMPKAARSQTNWRPYVDGRWRWTDFGWTWQSNEPFGWAVYHYGRWAKLPGTGWVWVPGSEWASAWVAWRFTNDAVGWAPLPPEAHSPKGFNAAVDDYYDIGPMAYVFIEIRDFDAPNYKDKVLPRERHIPLIESSANLTNISYARVGGRLILACGGPSVGHINNVLLGERENLDAPPIRRIAVQLIDAPSGGATADVEASGALLLHAPLLEHKPAPGKPTTTGDRVEIRDVERGWTPENAARDAIWKDKLKANSRAIEASERAQAQRAAAIKKTPPTPPPPKPTPTPTPPAISRPRPAAPPTPNPNSVQPSRLQPSSGLSPKRP